MRVPLRSAVTPTLDRSRSAAGLQNHAAEHGPLCQIREQMAALSLVSVSGLLSEGRLLNAKDCRARPSKRVKLSGVAGAEQYA